MAFPTTSVLDNFNRADGGLGAAWTNDPFGTTNDPPAISGNAVAVATFGRAAWWNAGTVGPDTEVYATVGVKPPDGAGWLQLLARIQSPGSTAGDAYKVELGPAAGTDAVDVYRVINGVDTQVGSTISQEFSAGDKLGVEILGTGATVTINVYRHNGTSWSLIGTVSDTNAARIVSAGFIGLGGFQVSANTMRIDDFGGGAVVTGGPSGAGAITHRVRVTAAGQKGAVGVGAITHRVRVAASGTSAETGSGSSGVSHRVRITASGSKDAATHRLESIPIPPFFELVPGSRISSKVRITAAGSAGASGGGTGRISHRIRVAASGTKNVSGSGQINSRVRIVAQGFSAGTGGGNGRVQHRVRITSSGSKNVTGQGLISVRPRIVASESKATTGSAHLLLRVTVAATGTKQAGGSSQVSVHPRITSSGSLQGYPELVVRIRVDVPALLEIGVEA